MKDVKYYGIAWVEFSKDNHNTCICNSNTISPIIWESRVEALQCLVRKAHELLSNELYIDASIEGHINLRNKVNDQIHTEVFIYNIDNIVLSRKEEE